MPFTAALKDFFSIPYSPRKAFTAITAHRTLEHALILIFASAVASAVAQFSIVDREPDPLTILYLIEVPYSDIAWITSEFFSALTGFACTILIAFLIIEAISKSGEPIDDYISAIGHFIPWSILVSSTVLFVWYSLWDTGSFGAIMIYGALSLPAFIWFLWIEGTAISVVGGVPLSTGVLVSLAAVFYWSIAEAALGWPIAFALPVVYFAWKTHLERAV